MLFSMPQIMPPFWGGNYAELCSKCGVMPNYAPSVELCSAPGVGGLPTTLPKPAPESWEMFDLINRAREM